MNLPFSQAGEVCQTSALRIHLDDILDGICWDGIGGPRKRSLQIMDQRDTPDCPGEAQFLKISEFW